MSRVGTNNKEPLVSVIVPVYNVEKYLRRCLCSIVSQSYENIEVIIVDDGSVDNSKKICRTFEKKDRRFRYFYQDNRGVSSARNRGLKEASGILVAFIDPDDYVSENYIDCLVGLLDEYDADVVAVGHNVIYENSGKNRKKNTDVNVRVFSGKEAIESLLYQDTIDSSLWGKLFKKNLFKNIVFPDNLIHEDLFALYYVFSKTHKVVFCNRKLYYYRLRSGSLLNNKVFSEHVFDILNVIENISNDVKKNNPDLKPALASRTLNADMHVIRQIPNKKYEAKRKIIYKRIKDNRMKVLFDKKVRRKTKIGIFISFFGFSLMKKMYAFFDKFNLVRTV